MNPVASNRSLRAAFTLVEVLIVLAVIAILASLLLPALGSAKRRAEGIACMNNLRQLQLAWTLYLHDHGDLIPPSTALSGHQSTNVPCWCPGVMAYPEMRLSWPWSLTDSTNVALMLGPGPGRLGPYVGVAQTYKCPGDRSTANIGGRKHLRVRSYSENYRMNPLDQDGTGSENMHRLADLSGIGPAQVFVFIDHHADSIDYASFEHPLVGSGRLGYWNDYPANRHNRTGPLTFADGHAEFRRWSDPIILRPETGRGQGGVDATPGNPDYQWLRDRTAIDPNAKPAP